MIPPEQTGQAKGSRSGSIRMHAKLYLRASNQKGARHRLSNSKKFVNTPGAPSPLCEDAAGDRSGTFVLLVAVAAAVRRSRLRCHRTSGQPDEKADPVFVDKIPDGYRDWKLISVAHEEGNLNSLGAILGNDVSNKGLSHEGKLPFPDGTIIAALHWPCASSDKAT